MSENVTPENEVICPVCGQEMTFLATIRRVFGEELKAFQCRPCGFSTTEPASWTKPPTSNIGGP
jgi:C4-type Zn-finger protein